MTATTYSDDFIADVNDSADETTTTKQKVKTRRRLEDYLAIRRVRKELEYLTDWSNFQDDLYSQDQLFAYGYEE